MEKNFINRLKHQIKYLKVESNAKGITMIALVITLIVLLIITAVSVGSLYGNDGIFSKARKTNEIYNREKARTDLEMVLKDATLIKYGPEGLDDLKLNEMLSKIGTVSGDEVTIDGYTYTIDRKNLRIKN